MSIEDTIGYHGDQNVCIVCGKALKPGEVLATLHEGGSKLPLCCPLCLEAYEKNPQPYLERFAKQTFRDEQRKLGGDASKS